MNKYPINNLSLIIFILIRLLLIYLFLKLTNFTEEKDNLKFWIPLFIFQIFTLLFLSFSFQKPGICKNESIIRSNNLICSCLNVLFYFNPITIIVIIMFSPFYFFLRIIDYFISLKNYRLYVICWTIIFDFCAGILTLIKSKKSFLPKLLGLLDIVSGICSFIFIIKICLKQINEQQIIHVDEVFPKNKNVNELAHMNLSSNVESQIINIGEAPVPEINNNLEEIIINNGNKIQQNIINNEEPKEQNINNDKKIEHFEGR